MKFAALGTSVQDKTSLFQKLSRLVIVLRVTSLTKEQITGLTETKPIIARSLGITSPGSIGENGYGFCSKAL
ncbi:hypothetical protein Moror_15134, partial [Moniliophthora roreri MCA 2997]